VVVRKLEGREAQTRPLVFVIDCAAMKTKSATKEPATIKMPENFERFAKALMAVPKKELDRELAKDERKKKPSRTKR